MKKNIFTDIIKKKIKVNFIYKNKYVVAFNDIKPLAPIHIIVIPKIYIKNFNSINDKNIIYLNKMLIAVKKISKIYKINKKGYRIIINCNKNGAQEINYLHLHILGGCYLGKIINLNK